MKIKLPFLIISIVIMGLLFHPACKSEEGCEFSILGTWSVTINIPGWDVAPPWAWVETLTFSGTDESGTIIGWNYEPGKTGTYSVANCTTVQMLYNYVDNDWGPTSVVINGTLTGASTMNGNGTFDDDYGLYNLTWNANKVM